MSALIRKFIAWIAGMLLILTLMGSPMVANASTLADKRAAAASTDAAEASFLRDTNDVSRYMTTRNGQPYFDSAKARGENANSNILHIGSLVNGYSQAMQPSPSNSGSIGVANAAGLPIWGNWCGPGHGGGRAVDTLDSLCRTHDRCYGSRGYFACSCDRNLVSGINRNVSKMTSRERTVAAAVSVYFRSSFCNPFK